MLSAIGAPATAANISFLDAWQAAEGGSATYNPLNTTQPSAGATNYNSVGVKNYASAQQGAAATAQTLANGYYPAILAGLQSGNPLSQNSASLASELSTWGTGPGFLSNLGNGGTASSVSPFEQVQGSDGLGSTLNAIGNALTGGALGAIEGTFDAASAVSTLLANLLLNAGPLLVGLGLFALGVALLALSWGERHADSMEQIAEALAKSPAGKTAETAGEVAI